MFFLYVSHNLLRNLSCLKTVTKLCGTSGLQVSKRLPDYFQSKVWLHTFSKVWETFADLYQMGKNLKKMSDFFLSNNTPFALLDCQDAFNLLTEKEKLYSHYLSKASWMGALIVLLQTSMESPLIFSMLHRLFSLQSAEDLKKIALEQCEFTEEDFTAFLIYTSGIFANLGNYKGFGDSKIVPNLDKDNFSMLIVHSKFAELHPHDVKSLLSKCLEPIYSLEDKEQLLGFPHKGTTKYLSKNFLEEDNEIITQFFKKKNFEAENSRLIKTLDDSGNTCYEIRLASVLNTDDIEAKGLLSADTENSHKFLITRGDYSGLLKLVNENLLLAKAHAANENEEQMINKYMESFHTGSLDAHKDGSRFWVQDKEPIIEAYIGFIESYKDPAGVRAEFEGFVAMVNKPMSAKFAALVNLSEELISLLPWPSAYEKDKFLQPDFSSLDLLTFACNDVPIGINIPNYDDIRQCDGFKNVTLGNVIRMKSVDPPNYLNKNDQELLMKYRVEALEVQTGLHELLGHGSGKLFQKDDDGRFNFDADQVLNYETNEKISSWYEKGETYSSVFGSFSSSYEECRAECIGLYLSTVPDVLMIFGLEGTAAEDVMYANWIDCVYAGIEALKCYDPKSESWLQAHGQAAYVMLQVLLECEGNFINVEKIKGEDGKPDLLFTMDRTKIITHGKPCMERFLKKLQLYKAIADKNSAKKMFDKYSAVTTEDKYPFLEYREIVMARRKPRRLIVQANTFLEGDKVKLKIYESSAEGLVESFVERYQDINIYEILEELWEKDKIHFS